MKTRDMLILDAKHFKSYIFLHSFHPFLQGYIFSPARKIPPPKRRGKWPEYIYPCLPYIPSYSHVTPSAYAGLWDRLVSKNVHKLDK